MVRQPIVAGRFYAASKSDCAEQLRACIPASSDDVDHSLELCGAIVPHAGWACSGRVTGRVVRALADRCNPQSVVLLGAVHAHPGSLAALYDEGAWETPLGTVEVDRQLAGMVSRLGHLIEPNQRAHQTEHSLEVQVPFIQTAFPTAKILPVMVPPSPMAHEIGEALGLLLAEQSIATVVLGTSDLTHYGPGYGMTSHGVGAGGLEWAKNDNDRRMIELIMALDAERIVPEANRHHNACGSGAIAATIAACKTLGASQAILLEHTTSSETLKGMVPEPVSDAVGYAGILFAR